MIQQGKSVLVKHNVRRKLSGGWKTRPAAKNNITPRRLQPGKDAVERVKVTSPDHTSSVELCFQQRFTIPPGSVSQKHDMTGTRIWPTASLMMEKLRCDLDKLRRNDKPLRILELGSGCGLLGMALAARGDKVLLTDHAANVEWLRQNVHFNQNVLGNRATTAVLSWGNEADMLKVEEKLRGKVFDAIVGSDVIYDPNSHHALVISMKRFALSKRAPVFLGYPDRDSNEMDFLSITKESFNVETMPLGDSESNLMYAVCNIRAVV